jgi:ornithine cyclodeaminase
MKVLAAAEVAARSPYPALVTALRAGLDDVLVVPERGVFDVTGRGDTLLTMPAWRPGGLGGVKIATVHPRNPAANLPSVQAQFFAFDTATGTPLALLDGTTLTNRRTAAVSALAVSLLARADSRRLLIVGAGALARAAAAAHLGVRDYDEAALFARDRAKAQAAVEALARDGVAIVAAPDLAAAVARADVIVTATTATTPFLRGAWVRPGAHVCLMGAFARTMAEADAELLGAARVFADTRAGVVAKGGEVAQAIAAGVFASAAIEDDLFGLVRRAAPVPRRPEDVTVFKSVGSAAFDLVAAELILRE